MPRAPPRPSPPEKPVPLGKCYLSSTVGVLFGAVLTRILGSQCVLITSDLADLITRSFREWSRKTFGFGHGHADHPQRGLTLSLLRLRRWEAGKEMIGVDKIDDIRRLGRGGASVASIARGHRGLRAHGEEVPEGDRPLREAAGGRQGARVAPARALRGAGRFVAARGQALLVQAAPHREEGLRPARRGEGLRGLVLDRQEVRERRREELAAELDAARRRGSCCSTGSRASARSTSGRPTSACEASSPAATSSWSRSRTQTSGSRRSSGRDRGVRLPGAPRRLRVPRGRAAAGRVRQRHRGRPQGCVASSLCRHFPHR